MEKHVIKRNPQAYKAYLKWLSESIRIERQDRCRQHWLEHSAIIAHAKNRRTKYVLDNR